MLRLVTALLALQTLAAQTPTWSELREVNPPPSPPAGRVTAVLGATLIDGTGAPAVRDSAVVIAGDRIVAVGRRGEVAVPEGAVRVDAAGLYLLPGMLDAHFHTNDPKRLTRLLAGGFTSMRDPGKPLPFYDQALVSGGDMPRAFLTGPHFDQKPHAYPHNAVDLQSEAEVRDIVRDLHAKGISAIKIYYRLPLELIQATCETADELGIPVTAHLELVRADDAIRAGLDGIEHVTSLGTALADEPDARRFERGVRADNAFRRDGRYWLWNRLNFNDNPKVRALLELMLERGVYLTPTLRPFEVRPGDQGVTAEKLAGFAKMKEFTAIAARAGVPIVASSHGPTPEAIWRELELLVDAGLTPAEAVESATHVAARFFGARERLGTVEVDRAADLVLLERNPLEDVSAVRSVSRVMLNGRWIRGE